MADELSKPIEKMLVKDLQAELKKRGLPTKGLKSELVDRLKEALQSNTTSEANGEEDNIKGQEEDKEKEQTTKPSQEQPSEKASSQGQSKVVTSAEKKEKNDKEIKKVEKKVEEEKIEEKKEEEQKPTKPKTEKKPKPKEQKEQTKTVKVVGSDKGDNGEQKPEKDKMDVEHKGREQNKRKAEDTEAADATKKEQDTKRKRRWGTNNQDNLSITPETISQIIQTPSSPALKPTTPTSPVVKAPVFPKTSPIPAASSPILAKKQEPEAPREVPPSKKPISNVLFISNFVRPFTKGAVADLLGKTGTVKQWEMDAIKSKCFVVYSNEEEATATRNALHNLVWPATSTRKLQVDYATESDARRWVLGLANSEPQEDSRYRSRAPPQKAKTLDDLFKKTQATPHIYYLPLTDSEVEAKKKPAPTNGDKK